MFTKSASELAAMVRAKEVSSRELLEGFVDRVERLNPPINAVVTLDLERARAAADAADASEPSGPLHGLPITIKDAIATEGIRSTGGAVELTDHVPTADAPAVARLKEAGAIVFGKTNLPRWSGDIESFNEIFGTTNNPWDVTRIPGGSSGGAGAAVAAGFTSFELGTDIGGSVRIPAHFDGVFGLKPTFGVINQRGYLDHVDGGTIDVDINVFGPLARSAEDLDLLLSVLAERDVLPAKELRRVGVWFDEPSCPVARDYRALLGAAADRLADSGVVVEEAHPPIDFADQVRLFSNLVLAAMSTSLPPDVADGASGSHHQWIRNTIERSRLQAIWAEWFESYDALLCPVTPTAALPHMQGEFVARTMTVDGVERPYWENTSWTGLIGVVGLPSAVPPIGRTPEGLPVGVQCGAPHLGDRTAIDLARRLGRYEVPPGF
ncbi:MAG TPA: amidase family protein [Acidimicrobiales bacterium]|nr:amidase family protein [Acidimicrobiales bacterium]